MNLKGKKALVVEDDKSIADLLTGVLREIDFDVIPLTDSRAAVVLVNELKFDLVLTDIKMPQVSGIELFGKIKKSLLNRNTPVVVFSGFLHENRINSIKKLGIHDVLLKPLNFSRLQKMVREIMVEKLVTSTRPNRDTNIGRPFEKALEQVLHSVDDSIGVLPGNVHDVSRDNWQVSIFSGFQGRGFGGSFFMFLDNGMHNFITQQSVFGDSSSPAEFIPDIYLALCSETLVFTQSFLATEGKEIDFHPCQVIFGPVGHELLDNVSPVVLFNLQHESGQGMVIISMTAMGTSGQNHLAKIAS